VQRPVSSPATSSCSTTPSQRKKRPRGRLSLVVSALNPAAARVRLAPPPLAAGALLSVGAPLAVLAVALAFAAARLTVQDSWLALVSGREVAEHGLPTLDHLTVLGGGHTWIDQQWLAGLLLYGAARVGGVGLALSLCTLAILVAFGIAAAVANRRGASPASILVFLALAVAAAPWGLQPRAQALALPLFVVVLALLVEDPRGERHRTLLVLPVLCLWANVHGSVVVGAALVFAYALRTRALRYLLAPLTVAASPYAPHLPAYYRLMLVDPPFGRYISEWSRTTPSPFTAAFFVLAAVAAVLAIRRRGQLGLFDHIALVLTLAVALEAIRGIIWFALAALALLPAIATRRQGTAFEGRATAVFAAAAIAVVVIALSLTAARPARAYELSFPAGLADVVRDGAGAHELVLANEATSDWLLWRVPELRGRLAYDVRFEVLTRAEVTRLFAWRNFAPGWRRVADPYAVVVDDPAHIRGLVATGRWRRVLAGSQIAVAERIRHAR